MAFPTTLAVITALWPEPARTRAVALWFSIGGAVSALGQLVAGALLSQFAWGSVFLVTIPLAVVAAYMAWRFVPAHVREPTAPVDHLGGILSVVQTRWRLRIRTHAGRRLDSPALGSTEEGAQAQLQEAVGPSGAGSRASGSQGCGDDAGGDMSL